MNKFSNLAHKFINCGNVYYDINIQKRRKMNRLLGLRKEQNNNEGIDEQVHLKLNNDEKIWNEFCNGKIDCEYLNGKLNMFEDISHKFLECENVYKNTNTKERKEMYRILDLRKRKHLNNEIDTQISSKIKNDITMWQKMCNERNETNMKIMNEACNESNVNESNVEQNVIEPNVSDLHDTNENNMSNNETTFERMSRKYLSCSNVYKDFTKNERKQMLQMLASRKRKHTNDIIDKKIYERMNKDLIEWNKYISNDCKSGSFLTKSEQKRNITNNEYNEKPKKHKYIKNFDFRIPKKQQPVYNICNDSNDTNNVVTNEVSIDTNTNNTTKPHILLNNARQKCINLKLTFNNIDDIVNSIYTHYIETHFPTRLEKLIQIDFPIHISFNHTNLTHTFNDLTINYDMKVTSLNNENHNILSDFSFLITIKDLIQ